MKQSRKETMSILADKYMYFLQTLPFHDELYMKGMQEGRSKFLANLHIAMMKKQLPKGCTDWRFSSDYVSERALEFLKKKQKWENNILQYDHMIPKAKYIKNICEEEAEKGTLTTSFIFELLMNYFWVATIHEEENKTLSRLKLQSNMPIDWDGQNIFARYEKADIALFQHDTSYLYAN